MINKDSSSRHDSGLGGPSDENLAARVEQVNLKVAERTTALKSVAKGCSFFLPGPLRRVLFSFVGEISTQIMIDERSSLADSRNQLGDSGVLRHDR